ncbi:unnamed protein product [Somion occarium]|uniref:Uncharacterized protein n=1 Tax=Somion occarium TaxID=3059160 RepID=A0ABP1DTI3_9APHY
MWPFNAIIQYFSPSPRTPLAKVPAEPVSDASDRIEPLQISLDHPNEPNLASNGIALSEGSRETPPVDQETLMEEIDMLLAQITSESGAYELPPETLSALETAFEPNSLMASGDLTCSETNIEFYAADILDDTSAPDDAAEIYRTPTIRLVTPPRRSRRLRVDPTSLSHIQRSQPSLTLGLKTRRPLPVPPPLLLRGSAATRSRIVKRTYIRKRDSYPLIESVLLATLYVHNDHFIS